MKVKIHTIPKLCHFGRSVAKAKLFLPEKSGSSRLPGWNVHMGKFSSRLPRSRRKNQDLDNRASPTFHMNTWKFLQRKEWRGGIRATPVDLAHMKRPQELINEKPIKTLWSIKNRFRLNLTQMMGLISE